MTARAAAPRFRAVLFDLDEALLARETAWRYTVEEAVVCVTGQRIDVSPLAPEYRSRPWHHVLSVVVPDVAARRECEELCREMFARSSMKRLLVHEGIGMALDHLRAARLEMGAVSREPHAVALKQIQSTGLDRFLAVLSATPGDGWDVCARLTESLAFLGYEPGQCAYVSGDARDLDRAAGAGFTTLAAAWVASTESECVALNSPGDLVALAV